jgi:hypothetical protein
MIRIMTWNILFQDEFQAEFEQFFKTVQLELLANLIPLEKLGPQLGRPLVDTLKGSKHANLKELRFEADDGVWRVAFAFDPTRSAILLVAGDKSGGSKKRFYKQLIKKADQRFDTHLENRKKEDTHG